MDELYLDNIDEYINDHNKIVTYKWLSLTLGVHVNTAKQMLFHYLDQKRRESSAQLHATYLVSGKCVENGQTSHKVSVVREDHLEDIKSKMSLVVSVHVYSIQKALLRDSGPLYSVDYDAVKDNLRNCSRYSAIHCAGAEPMSPRELQQVREVAASPAAAEPQAVKSNLNGHASVASKPPAKPARGIMGMFANKPAAKNQEAKAEPKEDTPTVDPAKSKAAVKSNPMANFFGTQTGKRPDKPVKKKEEEEEQEEEMMKEEEEEEGTQSPQVTAGQRPHSSAVQETPEDAVAVEPPKKASKTKTDSRSKTKRADDSDSEEEKMERKKRRRIKKPKLDSSDDEVIPDSPQRQRKREAPPSPKKEAEPVSHSDLQPGNSEMKTRKRRRVLKAHTFVDDEGCIVTEKAYQSESYSEAEEEAQAPKQAPKNPFTSKAPASSKEGDKRSNKKAAASANKGAKQASIMGFFQKK
ncbi:DNA polymerase delta subunit 3 [Genypterus blacodes]|uniref:DNA polymerase delta subunit 3 n=1 Tax=Genypterus blacodes TaxID=154954 RepID=UPI003F75B9CD